MREINVTLNLTSITHVKDKISGSITTTIPITVSYGRASDIIRKIVAQLFPNNYTKYYAGGGAITTTPDGKTLQAGFAWKYLHSIDSITEDIGLNRYSFSLSGVSRDELLDLIDKEITIEI